jgi:hypothetical protein
MSSIGLSEPATETRYVVPIIHTRNLLLGIVENESFSLSAHGIKLRHDISEQHVFTGLMQERPRNFTGMLAGRAFQFFPMVLGIPAFSYVAWARDDGNFITWELPRPRSSKQLPYCP